MLLRLKGGPGSGFHGHKGRPGEVGGSSSTNFFHTQYAQNTMKGLDRIISGFVTKWHPDVSIDAYKSDVENYMKDILDNSYVAIRVSQSALNSILDQGEIKSVFETKVSSAFQVTSKNKYLKARREFEQEVFDIDEKQKSGRPVYGYITQKEDGRAGSAWLEPYGDVAIYVKEDVRNRTTFTDSDSLDDIYQMQSFSGEDYTFGRGIPSSINDPSFYSSIWTTTYSDVRGMFKDAAEGKDSSAHPDKTTYWEAQIHGGVRVSDISNIVFTKHPPSSDTLARLDALGIKYSFAE